MKNKEIVSGLNCCQVGSHKCNISLKPWYKSSKEYIGVDRCLVNEILFLWSKGIVTSNSCCGLHVNSELFSFISVEDEYIDQMIQLGYEQQENPCNYLDKSLFIPKIKLWKLE